MNTIPFDEEERLISVIQTEARACICDIYKIRDDVKTEIENHRCGLTPAKDILRKDFDEYLQNVRNVHRNFFNIDGVTFVSLTTALLLPWRLFCLIFAISYHLFILGRKYFDERKFEVSFSTVDHAFIDEQYLKCCSENWIQEVGNFIDDNHEIFTEEGLEDFLNSVEIIQDLSQIREPLSKLKYYELLMKIRRRLISKDREEALVKTFKRICLEQVIINSQAFRAESYFIDSIVTFFRATKNIRHIIDKLQLKEFCSGELLLDGLIDNILNWSNEDNEADVTRLQEAADCLKEENKGRTPILRKTSINLIKAFIGPVEIKQRTSDGRSVIEVTGKVVVIGDVLSQLETSLVKNPNIDEVRFVGCDVMHIDRDLENLLWHGKNIVILSTFIRIHDQVTWNVSGKDNDHVYHRSAGTDRDGNGKQGADGYAGESGGNVLIAADEVLYPENFAIISNGGNGSTGQDGGNGKPGEDGKGIAANQFDEQFPSPVKVLEVGHERRDETVRRIRQLAEEGDVNHANLELPNMSIDAITKESKQTITFSYACGNATLRQAFLLCRGSLGQRGGDGGECGLGGQGGHNGEIITSNRSIAVRSIPGENGKMGRGGLYGDYGKNGHDMGYTDSQNWLIAGTQFHGRDGRSKLQLKYHDSGWFSAPSDAVWCPRRCEYVEITHGRIEHKEGTQYQERKRRLNNDSQRHALATKKKSISQGKILADYSHCFTAAEGSSQSSLESVIQRAMRALDEIAQQQEKVTTELKVKHLVASLPRDKNVRRGGRAVSVAYRDTTNSHNQPDIRSLIREVTGKAGLDNFNELGSFEMTRCELLESFHYLDTANIESFRDQELSGEPEDNQPRIVKQLLIEKYRFAVLREIAQNEMLPGNYFDDTDNTIESTAECATRYLVEAERNVTNISHHILGTLDQYFYTNGVEEREKMCKFCEEISLDVDNDEPLKHSIREFVLKAEKSKRVNPNVRKYCIEYNDFLKKQLPDLNIVLDSFLAELEKHKDMHDLWVRGNNDDSLRLEFNRRIQNREVLKVLYRCLNTQLRQTYDWRKCWGDKNFVEDYYDDIRKRGPLSEICRELLAHVYEVNIRFYSQDQDDKFHLVDNHNPSAKRAIHILNGENSLRQLKIDTNFLGLSRTRAKSGNTYAQILAKTDGFVDKQELDDYFETKTFLRHDVLENYVSQQSETLSEEQAILEIIKYLSCPDERLRIKERLLKISSQYIGHNRILLFILKRFSSDGRHVSYQELCSLVNSVLAFVVDDNKNDLNIFCWIVAAYPQDKWTSELVLLQIENHLRNQITDKSKWRDDLSRVTDKNILMLFKSKLIQHKSDRSISVEFIEDVVRLLSSIPNKLVNLDGVALSEWPCAMKEKYWHHKLSPLANAGQEDEKLSGASYYLLSMENIYGTSLVTKFIDIFVGKKPSLDILADTLSNFCTENWNLSEDGVQTLSTSSSVSEWTEMMSKKFLVEKKDRDVTRLVEIIKGNANTSKNIVDQLPVIEYSILDIESQSSMMRLVKWVRDTNNYQKEIFDDSAGIRGVVCVICQKEQNSGMTDTEIKRTDSRRLYYRIIFPRYWRTYLQKESDPQFLDEACTDMLAAIDKEVESTKGFKLRDTQKIAILALLGNERKTLAQVSTGEGKTLIVIVASIMKALHGEKVHIVTSSSVLAKRDAAANQDIYGLFGIGVAHNCSEDLDERKAAYSGSQVVYGDLSSFQRDYLLDKFYGENILGDSNLENVFADEVDSMLLDKGKNMLYLSHNIAGLDKLESVYLYIWHSVNRPSGSLEDYDSIANDKAIKESILDELYGLLKKDDIQKIDPKLSEQQVKLVWDGLVNAEILDEEGKMLTETILDEELEAVLSPDFDCYKNRLSFLLKERIGRAKCIHVPNYLKPFIEQHLESWIKSAKTAVDIQSGHDYVMDVDRTGNSQDLNANVTIVDRDTGTDQTNSQWDEALHQFLQLKHGCKLSMQSLKAVFISNVSYLKLYRNLYGLTGTLGSQRERALLMKIHDVDFVTIPTAKSKQFLEEPPIICGDKKQWVREILNESIEFAHRRQRSVLIICETIDAAQTLHKNFKDKRTDHVHLYTRNHEEFDIAQGTSELDRGQIIIATNLSGRGTDIRITKGLEEAGGLHVCLTYLPNNNRIEEQAFGRAARNGDRGTGRLIIVESGVGKHGIANIFDLKKNRDNEESQRISVLEAYYKSQIVTEERCFKKFEKQFRKLSKNLKANKEVDSEVTKIVLQTSINLWAFWLDKNSECVKHVTDEESRRNLNNRLDEFISQLKDFEDDSENIQWQSWVKTQPVQMIKIGKCFCRMKKYDEAIALFDRAIELEPNFSEAAHYYKGFALIRKFHSVDESSRKQFLKNVKRELIEAAKLFDCLSKRSLCAGGAVRAIRKYDEQTSIVQIDTYAEQQKSMAYLFKKFFQSINDIFDKPVTPESFINADISGKLSEVIYTNLRLNGILRNLKIKKTITEETWNDISLDSLDGTSVGELKDCLFPLRGRAIDENIFPKMLRQHVKLPSREYFWKLSIELGILRKEIKYVLVDVGELDKLDPTLWELLRGDKELRRPTLKSDEVNGIILYPELSEPQEGCVILEKTTLKKVLIKNNREYEFLEDRAVFSVNKRAIVDSSKISSTSLPRYDAIALQDFISANIPGDDAHQILAELVEQNVLRKEILPDVIYRLGIPSDSIPLIRLSSYPVYEGVVKELLSRCFIYRIALEIIEKQLQRGDSAYLRLTSHPHVELIYELLDQRIIKPVTLKREPDQLIAELRGVFNHTITQRDLEILFPRNGLIWEKSNGEKLCKELVEKKWLSFYQPSGNNKKERFNQCIREVLSYSSARYTINDSTHWREALSTSFRSVEKKLRQIFDDRLQLAEESTINHIVEVLKRSRSPLKTLRIPDGSLNALSQHRELDGSRHIEEVAVFTLNGLDTILLLEERKWSKMTMINAGITLGMGVSQIAVGAVIDSLLGQASTCTAVCIGGGIGDIIFAINSYRSGHFSWKAYRRHKIRSISLTATAISLGSVFAAGAVLDGTGITAATGRELIETVGLSRVVTSVVRSVASHTARAAAIGFSYTEVDVIIQNFGERIRDGLSSAFLSGITSKVEEHDVGTSLETMYRSLGREQAMKIIDDVTRSALNETSLNTKYLPIVTQSAKGVRMAMKEVSKQMGQGGKNALGFVSRILSCVLAALPWAERAAYVLEVQNITGQVLDGLEKRLKHAIRTHEMENPSRQQRVASSERVDGSEEFKREVIKHWNSVICEEARQIIEKHVVKPVIITGLGSIMMLCNKIIERECRTYNVGQHNRSSEAERREYREKKRYENTSIADAARVDELAERQVNEYHKTLGKLVAKTKNHQLSADARMRAGGLGVPRKRVIQLSHNEIWKEIDLDETVMFPVPSTSAEHPCTRRQTLKWPEDSWHDEPFSGVTTSDGFVLLYNSRSVAAAIGKSDNRRLQIVAYEEIGQSRSEYNSWRRGSKEAFAIVMARHNECRSRWRSEVFYTYCKQDGHTYKFRKFRILPIEQQWPTFLQPVAK